MFLFLFIEPSAISIVPRIIENLQSNWMETMGKFISDLMIIMIKTILNAFFCPKIDTCMIKKRKQNRRARDRERCRHMRISIVAAECKILHIFLHSSWFGYETSWSYREVNNSISLVLRKTQCFRGLKFHRICLFSFHM